MTREEARDDIRQRAREYLKRDKSGKGYVCPICGSGTGRNGTGITTQDGIHFTCWRGCFSNADIIDIIGHQYGLDTDCEKFNKAYEIYGVDIERDDAENNSFSPAKPVKEKSMKGFFEEASRHLEDTEYRRGISLETLRKFGVGFIPDWKHPKASAQSPASPRMIIPVYEAGYIARDTRASLTEAQKKYAKQRVGEMRVFNAQALISASEPVYIVEGEIDALSIIDCGGQAVGLGSTSGVKKFLSAAKNSTHKPPLIISMDNDEAGRKAGNDLASGLKENGFFSYRHNLPECYKDANEFMQKDREGFKAWIKEGTAACKEKKFDDENEARVSFEHKSAVARLNQFIEIVQSMYEAGETGAIPTGFVQLDFLLDGGLYPGLYIVGAISSLGKTTFCTQIADQIAQQGHGVLIFSLEMSSYELIAKSLSRQTLIHGLASEGSYSNALTTRDILRASIPTEGARKGLSASAKEYASYASNLYITEGIGNVGVEAVKAEIEQYMQFNSKPPVVIIDYLQILAPYSERLTDKQNVDKNVLELKRLSRDKNITVIGISSFNRENYKEPVSMASFKESGAIEYSSDVLLGLQYENWDYRPDEKEAERTRRIRGQYMAIKSRLSEGRGAFFTLEAKILKNRNGRKGEVKFHSYPAFNYFQEADVNETSI